ncbi:sugar phosphate isomerase/epimerase family protein [Nakamurella sp. GG22]
MDRSQLSLNTITVRSLPIDRVITVAQEHGLGGVAPWRHQLEDGGAERVAKLVRDAGLRVSSLCRGGMFTAPDAAGRAKAIEDNRRAINEAATLGAECLVLVCGPVVDKDVQGSWGMVADGIAAVIGDAVDAGVELAIEPLHPMMAADRSVVCRLAEALDLADAGGPGIGVVVDAYHVWWDITLSESIRRAGSRITGVHVSDWVSPLTGGLLSGRGMIGDGVIDLTAMVTHCQSAGYSGLVEVEILSDQWWAADPDVTVATLIERFERCI